MGLCGRALAEHHVVLVTPRGETVMERVFVEELRRRVGPVRFTLIKPDVNNAAEMNGLPARVRAAKPSLIYSWGTPSLMALAGDYDAPKISDIPIVFLVVTDPLRAKVVKDLKVPGRNVTGTSHLAPLSVQLTAMRAYKPFKKLGVVYNPTELNVRFMLEDLAIESKKGGFELLTQAVDVGASGQPDPSSIEAKIKLLKAQGAEWLYLGPDSFVAYTHRKLTTLASIEAGLPSFTANESAIRDGNALFGLFSPVDNLARFTALKASQVLRQERKIADIPVETLQRFSTALNMCAAIALNEFPPSEFFKQTEVIVPVGGKADPEGGSGQPPSTQSPKGCKLN